MQVPPAGTSLWSLLGEVTYKYLETLSPESLGNKEWRSKRLFTSAGRKRASGQVVSTKFHLSCGSCEVDFLPKKADLKHIKVQLLQSLAKQLKHTHRKLMLILCYFEQESVFATEKKSVFKSPNMSSRSTFYRNQSRDINKQCTVHFHARDLTCILSAVKGSAVDRSTVL